MWLASSVSGRPHSKLWWCHDIGYPLLAAEHSPYKAPRSGTPYRTTSSHSRSMSPLNSDWKLGFSLATSVLSALETSRQLRYINSHLPHHTIPYHIIRQHQSWSPTYLVQMCTLVSGYVSWSHLGYAKRYATKHVQRNFAVHRSCVNITDTGSVLCTLKDPAILQNLLKL